MQLIAEEAESVKKIRMVDV